MHEDGALAYRLQDEESKLGMSFLTSTGLIIMTCFNFVLGVFFLNLQLILMISIKANILRFLLLILLFFVFITYLYIFPC